MYVIFIREAEMSSDLQLLSYGLNYSQEISHWFLVVRNLAALTKLNNMSSEHLKFVFIVGFIITAFTAD